MTKFIQIGNQRVGSGQPAYIIAEIGVNHNGLLDLAIELIDIAVDAGANAVKFQKRDLDSLYPKEYLENENSGEKTVRYMLPILKRVELSEQDYEHIIEYCRQRNITFLCSAWDVASADFLERLEVPAYKFASADLTNLPLLGHVAKFGKPMILSTGMSTLEEVHVTVEYLQAVNAEFALLHCNSTYPCAFEDINLRFMKRLETFGVPIGYSGHERGIAISVAAVALGATIIERHLTLDRTMDGPDHAASLEPAGFKKMVRDIRNLEVALGSADEKFISRGEILNREVLAKSLVASRAITPGETITSEMVSVMGPGQGLSPQMLPKLLGRKTIRMVARHEPFTIRDLDEISSVDLLQLNFPLKWGFTVRFRDVASVLKYHPRVLEFHFTDQDLDESFQADHYSQELIVHAPEFWERSLVDLCATDEDRRKSSVALIQRSINRTREMAPYFIGTPKVVVHCGAMSLDHPIRDRERLVSNLRRSVEELDASGVEFLLENLPPRPWYFGGQWITNAFMDAHEIADFCDSMGGLKICLDTSHLKLYCNWAHKDFYEQARFLAPYACHLHLSDGAGLDGEGLQIGEGTIDFVAFFKIMQSYRGSCIPEVWRGHQRDSEGFVVAIQRLAESWNRALAQFSPRDQTL